LTPEIEEIPNDDAVTRLVDFPRMYDDLKELIWDNIFQFSKEQGKYLGESVNWGKYAPPPDHVHQLGCQRENMRRAANPDFRYVGYVEAITAAIREIKNVNGHGFAVNHVPSEGQHHAEVSYLPNPNNTLTRTDRIELRVALRKVFGSLVSHSCGT
jgi:hypothetical protein